jgi:hypothetical protein
MRKFLFLSLIVASITGCTVNRETKILSAYLDSFGKNINTYKVVCIVPADGCGSCIAPSLEYSKTASGDFLLILTSVFEKSIKQIIDTYRIDPEGGILDHDNLAVSYQLVIPTAPCYYFIEKGKVVRVADLSKTYDKTGILTEVDKFLGKGKSE